MEELSISEKMKRFIRSKGLQISEFESIVGWKQGTVRKMTDSFKKERLLAVVAKFPDFDITEFMDVPRSAVKQFITDSNVGAIVEGTNINNNYNKGYNASEHDELIKLRAERESLIRIIENVADPNTAISVVASILGANIKDND